MKYTATKWIVFSILDTKWELLFKRQSHLYHQENTFIPINLVYLWWVDRLNEWMDVFTGCGSIAIAPYLVGPSLCVCGGGFLRWDWSGEFQSIGRENEWCIKWNNMWCDAVNLSYSFFLFISLLFFLISNTYQSQMYWRSVNFYDKENMYKGCWFLM